MRNSSLVEWFCAENVTGLKCTPKLGLQFIEQRISIGAKDFSRRKEGEKFLKKRKEAEKKERKEWKHEGG